MKKLTFAFLTMLLLASVAVADTLYLRDGRTIRGTLLGFVNGRFAFRVSTTQTGPSSGPIRPEVGEIQFFRPNEVDRLEIEGRSLDDLKYESRSVEVPLGSNWIDSGIDLRRGERVQVTASGIILVGRSRINPDGLKSTDPTSPLPNSPEGILIGAIGNDSSSPAFELGASREFVAERDGRLFLTSNRGSYADARGSFTVQVKRERDLTALNNPNNSNNTGSVFRTDPNARTRTRQTDVPQKRTPQDYSFDVAGTSRGVDTALDVRVGDQIVFTATGKIIAGRRLGEVGPEGGRSSGFGAIVGTRPLPSAGPGALIGYIRLANGQNTQAFLIGSQSTLSAPADGRLYLAINDDDYSDNGGAFKVTVKY